MRFFIIFLFSCFLTVTALASETPTVIVSIPPQKWMVEQLAGDTIRVVVLASAQSDPHSYEPTPSQLRECAHAQLYLTIGVPFETVWVPRITGTGPLKTVSTITGIHRIPMDTHEHKVQGDEHGHSHNHMSEDPHVWLSPSTVQAMLPVIASELAALLPNKAHEIQTRRSALSQQLAAIDAELKQDFSTLPEEKRAFLTFHPTWGYFARDYNLKQLVIEIEGKEPGPRLLKTIIDHCREQGIQKVFIEPQYPQNAAKTIAQALGGSIVEVNSLAENLPEIWRNMSQHVREP